MMIKFYTCVAVAALTMAASFTADAQSDSQLLGVVEFPTSGAKEAQPKFIEGLLYMHNFEYREAADAFKEAQEIDPDFAMAYWGEVMTYNHPLWFQQGRKTAEDALRRLGRTPEDRQAKCGTQREKDYLWTAEILYGTVDASKKLPKNDRDDLYRDAMRRLHEKYPEDHEATTLYALSILGTAHEGRETATYIEAAAVLHEVWDANRMHPGAAHYLIHSYDDPIHAPLGLPMARAYANIAPAAAHAQHMVSHIFVALGMWDDTVSSNSIAIGVEEQSGDTSIQLGHYPHWLEYGLLEQGRYADAKDLMESAYMAASKEPTSSEFNYFARMFALYVVETQDWASAEKWSVDFPIEKGGARDYYFAQAYAAARQGDVDTASDHLDTLRTCTASLDRPNQQGILDTLEQEILGLIALKSGSPKEAVEILSRATETESTLSISFGPPRVTKPSYELLGEVLLELEQSEQAKAAFEEQLRRTPRRTASLLGLAHASAAVGDNADSDEQFRVLASIWHSADTDISGYREAVAAGSN